MRKLARELLEQQLREAGRARDNCMQEGDQTAQEQRLNLNPRAVMYRLKLEQAISLTPQFQTGWPRQLSDTPLSH